MSCSNPLLALDFGLDKETGKHRIKILPKRVDSSIDSYTEKYGDSLIRLPCGTCDSCRLTHRKNWSIRCMLESKGYLQNSFVTITYDDAHYEPNKANRKEDLQKFIHALRDSGIQFRYFACGEYGSLTGRFHYHAILFGYFPPDAKPLGKRLDNMYYKSETLNRLWRKGSVIVGECTPESCSYVAGYVNKKSELGKQAFITMSNRPGIGYDYFISHRDAISQYGVILGDHGTVHFLPKYANSKLEEIGVDLTAFKDSRIDDMRIGEACEIRSRGLSSRDELAVIKGREMKDKLSKKRRNHV